MLNLRWKGKNIAEILQFSFLEAADFFSFDIKLKAMMGLMVETGLGYLSLGQSSPTLSGGEAQRVKLVSEMSKGILTRKNINQNALNAGNLYILEEPSIGLHSTDCVKLMHLLHRLVDDGHTVIVIEHNLDLLANADYLVEIGPKGGDDGGKILFSGKPEEIVEVKGSPTAPYLKPILNN
jgi:excinuclease ABC subunit A